MKTFRFVALGLACACAAFLFSLSPAAAQTDVWSGTNTNSWDTAGAYPSSYNWNSGSGYYSDGDAVIFNDGAQNTSIAIQSNGVGPASVNFATASGAAYSYSFSGGPIGDNGLTGIPTTVTLAGTGSVTFSASNAYSGGTYIGSGSTLSAGYSGALGTGPVYLKGGNLIVSGGVPGLLQGEITGYANWTGTPASWTPVLGPVNAYTAYEQTAPYAPWYQQTTWAYQGYIYFPGNSNGNEVSFGWHIDDAGYLLIDGTAWQGTAAAWNADVTGVLTPGWHQFEWFGSNNGGPGGPSGGIGFGWDPTGNGNLVETMDPGNGSLFTYGNPGTANFANDVYVSGGTSTLSVSRSCNFDNLNLAGSLHVSGSSGYLNFTGGTISSSPTMNIDGGLIVTIPFLTDNGTSAGAFSKAGSGALVLTGANSFVKGTSFKVSGGSLVAVGQGGGSGPLGSSPITLAGGTLVLAVPAGGPTALTVDLSSSPAGNPLTLSGGNNTIIAGIGAAGSAATIGSVTLTHVSGALTIAAGQGLDLGETDGCTLSLDPGLVFANSGTLSFGPGAFSLAGTSNLLPVGTVSAISGGTLTLGGLLTTGTYAPLSGGEVVLSGTYNFSGGTATALVPAVGGTLVLNELHNTAATGGTLNVANGAFLAGAATAFGQSSGASAVALELDGGTLGATVPLTGSSAVANPLVWGTTKTLNIGGTSALQLSGSLAFVSSKTNNYIINDPSGMLTLSGSLSGAGALTLIGSPTISVLGNSNSGYTGVMTLGNGSGITSVTIGSPYALGKGTLSFNGGGLEASTPLTGSNAVPNSWGIVPTTTSNILTADFGGSNPLELSGPAALLSGSYYLAVTNPALRLTLSGSISSSAGAHLYVAPGAGGTLVLDNPNNTFGGGTGGLVLQSLGGYVDVNGASSTVTSGSLSKGPLGIGTVTLGSANEGYIGLLNSSATAATLANPLVIYDACTYGSSSGLTLAGAVTLSGLGQGTTGNEVMDFLLTPNSNIVFSGLISSAGTQGVNLRQGSGSGGLTLSNTASSYKGNTSITMGTLIAGGNVPYGLPGVFGASTTPITIGDANSGTNAAELVTNGAYNIARGVTVNATAGPTTLGTIFAGVSTYSGAITLNNTNTVGFSAAAGGSVLVTGSISGSGGFTAASPAGGNVSLMATNSYTGATTLSSGQLTLDYNAAGVGSGIVPATSGVVLNGGTLAINGNGSMPVNESFSSTTITGYDSATISVSKQNNEPVQVSLGTLLRQNQGTMDLASGANGTIIPIAPVNGIAAGFITVNQQDWLFASGTPSYVPDSSSSAFGSAASNVDVQAGGTPASFGGAANSLRFNTPAVTSLNLPGALTLTTGGILMTPAMGSGTLSITGGSLTSSGGTGNQGSDVTINQFNTGTLTIGSAITNSGTTAIGLTKVGSGKLILTGQNTYTGPTTVGAGSLQIGDGTAGHDASVLGSIVNASGNPLVFDTYGSQSYPGAISGNGGLTKSGTGTATLGGASSYSGPTVITQGTLQLNNSSTLALSQPLPLPTGGTAGVFSNVPEAAGYTLAYQLAIGTNANLSTGVPYTVDNAASIPTGSFGRVGYYLEVQKSGGPLQWVYVSFNAAGVSTNASMLGVPIASTGEFYNYANSTVSSMNIFSNVAGITTGTNLGGGVLQFWPSNYGNGNGYGVPNANANQWGLADDGANTTQGYGSMKIGDYLTGQMLMSFNDWNGATYDLGLGNGTANGVANNDYTFSANVGNYVVKNLEIVVGYANVLPITTPVSIAAGATLDLGGVYQPILSLAGNGSVINSNSASASVLVFSPTGGSSTFSGTIGGNSQGPLSLAMNGSGTQTLTGALSGTGDLTVNAGNLVLGGVNPIVGSTVLSGGTLQVTNPRALEGQTLTLNGGGGVLNYGSLPSLSLGGLAGSQNWSAPPSLTVGGNGFSNTYSGNLSGAASLTVTGPGGLYLSGTNGLTNVAVNGGVLEVATTAALAVYATPNAVSVAGGAVLTVPTGDGVSTGWSIGQANSQVNVLVNSASWANNAVLGLDTSNGDATYIGNIPSSGSSGIGLAKLGANALTLSGSANFSGPTTVGGGTLNFLATNNMIGALAGSGSLVLNAAPGGALTVNSGGNSTFSGTISEAVQGSGNLLVKTGPGLLTLMASNGYSGGTTINQGGLVAANVNALGSGPVTLGNGKLSLATEGGVGGFGTMQLNGGATLSNGVLTLTDGNGNEARSAFTSTPLPITNASGFSASFVYMDVAAGAGNNADGATFCIQNDPAGAGALGGGGGALGWQGINNTAAVGLNVYSGNGGSGTKLLYNFGGNTQNPPGYTATSPVNLTSGDPILVNLTYNGVAGTLTEVLTDQTTMATYSTTYSGNGLDLQSVLGGQVGYVGFTAGTGGQESTQTISDFIFSSGGTAGPPVYANDLSVTAGKSAELNLSTAYTQVAQVGNLTLNALSTLSVTRSGANNPNAPYTITTGTVAVAGNAVINVANNGTGLGTLALGSLSGSGNLTFGGPGAATLTSANGYTGQTVLVGGTLVAANGSNGSATGSGQVNVNGGVLASDPVLAGTIGGNVVANSGGQIAPGGIGQIGTLAISGNLSLNNSSTLDFDVSGGSADLLTVGGTLSVSGIANVALSSLLSLTNTSSPYILATYTTSGVGLSQGSFRATGTPLGYQFEVNTSNDDLELDWVGLPTGPAVWTGASNVNWSNNGNWSNGAAPNGKAASAVVGAGFADSAGQAQNQITLDTAVTLGTLTLSNSLNQHGTGYALTGAALTMDNTGGSGPASILVTSASHTIAVPLNIGSGSGGTLSIQTATDPNTGNPTGLTITGSIGDQGNGTGVLELSGPGTLVLANSNTYGVSGGGTIVSGGTLIATCSDAIPAGTSLSVGAGGVFIYDPSQAPTAGSVVAAGTVAAVPEPGTLTLLAAGLAVAAAFGWRRRRVAK